MCAEGATKGLIKRGEVATEMCTKGFSFFYSLLCESARVSTCACTSACAHFPCREIGPPLRRHTGSDTHIMSGLLLTD